MNAKNKKMIGALVLALALFVLGLGLMLFQPFSSNKDNQYVYIDSDDTLDSLYMQLEPSAGLGQMALVRACSWAIGLDSKLHSGRYQMGKGVTALRMVRNIRGQIQAPVRLVIPVTHTMQTLAGRLSNHLMADSASLAQAFADTALLQELGVDTCTVPCLFIPDTYEVYWDITPRELLERMKKESDRFWTPERTELASKANLTPNEVCALASIVERESANEAERPKIAGMYINRLHQNMKLQADPTVKFALRNFALRRILHVHLMTESPYNTYLNHGLPPGPICIPSRNAIMSVLNYSKHKYLYMCAKEDFSGTHNFASTYAEHLQNARRYASALDARGVK